MYDFTLQLTLYNSTQFVYLSVNNKIIINYKNIAVYSKNLLDRLINYQLYVFYVLFDHLLRHVSFVGYIIRIYFILRYTNEFIMHYCGEIITIIFSTAGSHTCLESIMLLSRNLEETKFRVSYWNNNFQSLASSSI